MLNQIREIVQRFQPPKVHEEIAKPEIELWQRIEQQYYRCLKTLNASNLLELLPEMNAVGIRDLDGVPYPFPSLSALHELFVKDAELIQKKWEKGFTQLQLTPMALPLARLMLRTASTIASHANHDQFFLPSESLPSSGKVAYANTYQPVSWTWRNSHSSLVEIMDQLRYLPQNFSLSQDQHGLTKKEFIAQTATTGIPGWSVAFIQNWRTFSPYTDLVLSGAPRSEYQKKPETFLKNLHHDPRFANQNGFTIEEFLTHFMSHLQSTNCISESLSHFNSILCVDSFRQPQWGVPSLSWNEHSGQLHLDWQEPFLDQSLLSYWTLVRLK